jgi:hypothetical protein
VTTQEPVATIRPADLRNYEGVLYVRNDSRMTISFDDDKGTVLTLPSAGKDDSIQVLPIEMARNPGFQKMWRRGEVSVSTDPAIEEELTLMEARAQATRDAQFDELSALMDSPPDDKDLVPDTCLHCQKTTFVAAKQKRENSAPTLCEDHKDLAHLFVLDTSSNLNGESVPRWVSTSVATKRAEQRAAKSVATAEET